MLPLMFFYPTIRKQIRGIQNGYPGKPLIV